MTLFILLLLGGGCTIYASYRLLGFFTSTEPITLPPYDPPSQSEQDALLERVQDFSEAVSDNQPAQLILDSDDLNTFIAQSEDLADIVRVELDDDLVVASGSFPIANLPFLGERYLNGSLVLDVEVTNGVLDVNLIDFTLPNHSLADEFKEGFITGFEEGGGFDEFLQETSIPNAVRQIDSLVVENGQVIVTN